MGRIVDERRHTERRDAILSEAYRQFAVAGYDRTSTASICRAAGISSGTFFHYFPTKLDALVGVLRSGLQQTRQALSRIEAGGSGLRAVLAYAEGLRAEMADPHFGVVAGQDVGSASEASASASNWSANSAASASRAAKASLTARMATPAE